MGFSSVMVSLAGPVVKRALSALGIGVVSFAAVQVAFNQVRDFMIGAYGQISGDMIWLVELAGVNQAIGIVLGAMAAKVGLQALSKLGKLQS